LRKRATTKEKKTSVARSISSFFEPFFFIHSFGFLQQKKQVRKGTRKRLVLALLSLPPRHAPRESSHDRRERESNCARQLSLTFSEFEATTTANGRATRHGETVFSVLLLHRSLELSSPSAFSLSLLLPRELKRESVLSGLL
jgi:hypothetical protein